MKPFVRNRASIAIVFLFMLGCSNGDIEEKSVITKGSFSDLSLNLAEVENKASTELKPQPRQVVKVAGDSISIRSGQGLIGELEPSDATLADGSYADQYAYTGQAGEQVRIVLDSQSFDAFLILGSGPPGAWERLASDDDGGGGTNALLEAVLPEAGVYTIVVNSFSPAEEGAYSLSLGSGAQGLEPGILASEVTVDGNLDGNDLSLDDGTYYDAWMLDGRAGDSFEIILRSADFDAYLIVASGTPGSFEFLSENDDGAGGLDSQLTFMVPEDGVYSILANSFDIASGDYSLEVREVPDAAARDYVELYPGGGRPDAKYALLVGISDYPGDDDDLSSPAADARIMRDVLVDTFEYDPANVMMVLDQDATRDHIINAFLRHLGQAGPNGTALFYYSGHGTQLDKNLGLGRPLDPEDGDDLDEALYVAGYDGSSSLILDDELGYLLDQLSTDRTLVILDSCNSGTGTRGAGVPKQVSMNLTDVNNVLARVYVPREIVGAKERALATPAESSEFGDLLETQQPHVLLAGSRDDEISWVGGTWPDRGGSASVFTYYLADALETADNQTTFSDLVAEVRAQTIAYTEGEYGVAQTPQVGGQLSNMSVVEFLQND